VALPGIGDWEDPTKIAYRLDNPNEFVLPYRHFSVVFALERRLPLFSAVNINGALCVEGVPRTDIWKRDPRIDPARQILEECYGSSTGGFFSRGHMTRREDPNWGEWEVACQADADTFHATNAAPQAQSFNSPIWFGLEKYLLENAHSDEMRVSAFTGPVLAEDDLELFGIKIPSRFWKVIVFRHDETGALTATGYLTTQVTQVKALRQLQHVFGAYKDWQVPLATISEATGLNFSHLTPCDPLRDGSARFALQINHYADICTS
jgi:endonuclease G